MMCLRTSLLALLMVAVASFLGCSDDDDPVEPHDPDPSIVSVVVAPESATFTSIGQEFKFTASAFDAQGAEVDTTFEWQTSQSGVVVVESSGLAISTGVGTAEIYASSGGFSDVASVVVDIIGAPLIEWAAGISGEWHNAANWTGGAVPGSGDIAVINTPGNYTVSLTADATVRGIVLGSDSGTQTIETGAHTLTFSEGALQGGAELQIAGEIRVLDDLVWNDGKVTGTGELTIERGAELDVTGESLDMEATLNNEGVLTLFSGASMNIRGGTLDNGSGAITEFRGDATLTVQSGGSFNNIGTIEKNHGKEEAAIIATSDEFTSSGTIRVSEGGLWVSGGSLSGTIDIADRAVLRQSGNTTIADVVSRGSGALEIGGRVTAGAMANEIVTLGNVILDSRSSPTLSGPADLRISGSLTWRRGVIGDLAAFTTQSGTSTIFESSGTKGISAATWLSAGYVAGDEEMDLSLSHGAGIRIETGRWVQTNGGTVSEGANGSGGIYVAGELYKTGPGEFIIETSFDCAGVMEVDDGAVRVKGPFRLQETGLITGGGTGNLTFNIRLILLDAPSATMRGTLRPDLDGSPARFDIQGIVTLEQTFRLELDVPVTGDIITESVNFLTAGQTLGGTLALDVKETPVEGVDYQVVFMSGGFGTFDEITGAEQFTEIIQEFRGVILRR